MLVHPPQEEATAGVAPVRLWWIILRRRVFYRRCETAVRQPWQISHSHCKSAEGGRGDCFASLAMP